jgi:FkbM family methyltransferase
LGVLIGIWYHLRTFGIPKAFSDGIRAGNAVRLQLGVKLSHYSRLIISRIKWYHRVTGVSGLVSAIKGKITRRPTLLQLSRRDIKFPFFLRVPSSDVLIFKQIFMKHEYDFNVKKTPSIIVDAGANIGLASIYFANKFPDSKIIAIEPEESNFEILKRNIEPYGNIIPVCAALWHDNTLINVVDRGFGKWGFMTYARDGISESYGEILHKTHGITVDTIMKEQDIEHIDILKIDIEGSEREVFRDPSSWIEKVDTLIIELHENMKSGCNRSFYSSTNGFDDEWLQGHNVFLTRSGGCLTRGGPDAGPARCTK